ncbi:cellulose synthase [Cellvibrio mixtus]|uniref:Cellulose synthase n=1 Tax=Cellvibrio mixtus TaxID=39650 RepID=A0A266Q4F9_9GAMM|nr:YaeQ family protein [Cellvibrio mixtus]OZY84753.1 cellulose synthase [Cellvibrio mixtus]
MAEKATIYKATITLADMDRSIYGDYNLTVALHPSETVERMMVRILAFCYCAAENLTFTKGLSSMEEPDLWLKHDNGTILQWIEVGQPAPDRLKKASSQAQAVHVFSYGRGMDVWWRTNSAAIRALPKVTIHHFAADELQQLCALADKTMKLTVTITETIAYVSSATENVALSLRDMPQ